ncbi:Protein kinase C [Venustampulla echinocandica]|uniref:protein kinase C n=1 Tax=Venustampulla echinocandica TaxID=2656787 RepID=A0A370TWQ2_9HELO|nr:Protein kinase C [Venustampulla echinocandica]RDL39966.1 Protein kinase C [Venustampulla echinocandica]
MNNDDDALSSVYKKIERERALLNAANQMRQQTQNEQVRARIDTQMREGRRNIQYLEERMQELQMRRLGQGVDNMSMGSGGSGGSGGGGQGRPHSTGLRNDRDAPPAPPPKDSRGGYMEAGGDRGGYGQQDYQQVGGHGDMMPPRHPYAPPGPGTGMPKSRPNFTKLDLIKYDTPHLGPRIQLMLSQLEFKLNVEKQYLKGIEKMVQLYQMEGDRKSRADAAGRRVESNQKIQLLKQALKRYEDLHIDMESTADAPDDDSINTPNMRKPLTGLLTVRVHAVKDVDHATTGRFARGPETFVALKVEDNVVARTKTSRTDRWDNEFHNINVEKANEIELTVYDKPSDHPLPIGLLWIRLSDIVEEMRRKKIEAEINSSGWVSADRMADGGGGGMPGMPPPQFNMNPTQPQYGAPPQSSGGGGPNPMMGAPNAVVAPQPIDAWFALEPTGAVHLTISFTKQAKDRRPFDVGLNRKGAIRQRKEEVHEMYGHKFVQQQFYNIMRCALCGDFLKYSAGMQCEDCKYTCHTKCYSSVVTKCISKSNAETDPDEEKINHRIPHRFEKFSNMSANWCCHCGYILPFGKKNCRKCSECSLTCHAQCVHLVPDFCGMSMAVANVILDGIRNQKRRQTAQPTMSGRTLRPQSGRTPEQGQLTDSGAQQVAPDRINSFGSLPASSPQATEAAKTMYSQGQTSPQRPPGADRSSSSSAMAAASAAMSGQRTSSQRDPYQRASTDYTGGMSSGGYSPSGQLGAHPEDYGAPPKPQAPSHPAYNPAAYVNIGGYPPQQPQQAQQPQQQPMQQQQTPTAAYYNAPGPTLAQAPISEPAPPSVSAAVVPQKAAPAANEPGTGRRIGLDHFNFLAVLGKGNFGKVMLAETKQSKQLYAIKVLKKEFIIENDEVESTRSEKRVFLIANKERHPFLLSLHACFQTETRVYFVMEYISGGDLMLHIQRGQFGTKRAQFYAAEVCLALKYFHENGVIYRDLKLDNILLTLDGHIKIADYGLCKEEMYFGSTTSTFCGTPEFMAPEILLDKKYGRAVDWWAFGVLIYQMLLQQSPFRGEDEDEIYDAILADEPLYPIHMPRDSVSILQKLLTREPDQRLGSGPTDAQEIMSQPFFRNINWDDVYHKRIQPPFQPQITSATDTSNFDSEFTSVTPVLTPVQSVLSQAMQEEFRGFSYSADFI